MYAVNEPNAQWMNQNSAAYTLQSTWCPARKSQIMNFYSFKKAYEIPSNYKQTGSLFRGRHVIPTTPPIWWWNFEKCLVGIPQSIFQRSFASQTLIKSHWSQWWSFHWFQCALDLVLTVQCISSDSNHQLSLFGISRIFHNSKSNYTVTKDSEIHHLHLHVELLIPTCSYKGL